MADVKELPASPNKLSDKNNTGNNEMLSSEAPPTDYRPTSGGPAGPDPQIPSQPPPRPPLARADSRSSIQPVLRPASQVPSQPQVRPQFQPGGPVNAQPQFVPRPGTPAPRAAAPIGPAGSQQYRGPPPQLRQAGPQSFAPSLGPRQPQPGGLQHPQRVPPPSNLQFGPRQPPQLVTTPEGSRPPGGIPANGVLRAAPPIGPSQVSTGQAPKPFLQGSNRGPENFNTNPPKSGNLENQNSSVDIQNVKTENGHDMPEVTKGRSYSVAAAPGSPSPLKLEDDRRKSVSSIGGKIDELSMRSSGLGLIQEGKVESKENLRGSKESVRSEMFSDGVRPYTPDRPESRISGSKMTESFIGSLPTAVPKKKQDDDDDVILQNINKNTINSVKDFNKGLSDRSPSLTRSDESPEPIKQTTPAVINKPSNVPSESPRPKTPKSEPVRQEVKYDQTKDIPPLDTPQKLTSKSPVLDSRPPVLPKKPNDLNTNNLPSKSTPRKSPSATKTRPKDGDNDSGVDESTQGNDLNGSPESPNKKAACKLPMKEKSNGSLRASLSRSSSKSAAAKTPENPPPADKKKVPMNKIQVGNAPSPNIKAVKSKIGSLGNATYKPGGGKVKIENRKVELANVTPRIAAKNDAYIPSGGSKKIVSTKLEWNAKSKIGSLQNTSYKPGGGDKKIETVKLDFKEKAKPKVASTVNITHKAGGGAVKPTVTKKGTRSIENQKLDFKAQSKVGSLENVKHKPGGGVVKIFDDKEYIKQMTGQSPVPTSRSHSRQEDHYFMSVKEWSEEDRPMSRCLSARAPRTPRTPRALSPRKQVYDEDEERVLRNNERNKRSSRPATAREPTRGYSRRASVTQRPAFSVY